MIYSVNGKALSSYKNFIDVTEFGAMGDGVTDDTSSIQNALNSLSLTGGCIYFPSGTYLLTSYLVFYSNQTLWFDGATLLQGAPITALLISNCGSSVGGYNGTHDVLIYGATFDGGNFTEPNTLASVIHGKNIIFENCIFKNAYGSWHDLEFNATYNGKVINCDFEGSRKSSSNGCLIQLDAATSSGAYPWEDNRGLLDSTACQYIEIASCIFHDDTVSPAIGNHTNTTSQYVDIHDNTFIGFTSSRGTVHFSANGANNVNVHDNLFVSCTIGVDVGGATYHVYGNRFISATTAIVGTDTVAHDNIINGSHDTAGLTSSDKAEIVEEANKTVTVSGTDPVITGTANTRYICGEVSTLSITPPASGIIDVLFTSGSSVALLTVTPPVGETMKWSNGFDPTSLETNTVYEISIMDGVYGAVMSWGVTA